MAERPEVMFMSPWPQWARKDKLFHTQQKAVVVDLQGRRSMAGSVLGSSRNGWKSGFFPGVQSLSQTQGSSAGAHTNEPRA